jgi:hypothetical protein
VTPGSTPKAFASGLITKAIQIKAFQTADYTDDAIFFTQPSTSCPVVALAKTDQLSTAQKAALTAEAQRRRDF